MWTAPDLFHSDSEAEDGSSTGLPLPPLPKVSSAVAVPGARVDQQCRRACEQTLSQRPHIESMSRVAAFFSRMHPSFFINLILPEAKVLNVVKGHRHGAFARRDKTRHTFCTRGPSTFGAPFANRDSASLAWRWSREAPGCRRRRRPAQGSSPSPLSTSPGLPLVSPPPASILCPPPPTQASLWDGQLWMCPVLSPWPLAGPRPP